MPFIRFYLPNQDDGGMWIHQDAWFHMGEFNQATETEYITKKQGNGIYIFVIEGAFKVGDQQLNQRDALGFGRSKKFLLLQNPIQKYCW